MKIPVLKREGENVRFLLLDMNDVLFIRIENRNIVYHTQDEKYDHISTLSDLEQYLFDFGFDLLDKTNIVNMKRIKKLDAKHGNIYFEEQPGKESKFASIALIKQKVLKEQILETITNNLKNGL